MTHATFALRTIHEPTTELERRARVPYGIWAIGLGLAVLVAVCSWLTFVSGGAGIAGPVGLLITVLLLLGLARTAVGASTGRSVARSTLAMRKAIAETVARNGPMRVDDVRAHLANQPSPEVYDWRRQIALLVEEHALTESQGTIDLAGRDSRKIP